METTSNRLDFVQVCSLAIFNGNFWLSKQKGNFYLRNNLHTLFFLYPKNSWLLRPALPFSSFTPRPFFLWTFTPRIQSQNETRKCLDPFCGAEKSGHGDEEGWHQGSDHVDRFPGCSVHHSFRFGVLDIAKCTRGLSFLSHLSCLPTVICGET